jgi:hypothetical protein
MLWASPAFMLVVCRFRTELPGYEVQSGFQLVWSDGLTEETSARAGGGRDLLSVVRARWSDRSLASPVSVLRKLCAVLAASEPHMERAEELGALWASGLVECARWDFGVITHTMTVDRFAGLSEGHRYASCGVLVYR